MQRLSKPRCKTMWMSCDRTRLCEISLIVHVSLANVAEHNHSLTCSLRVSDSNVKRSKRVLLNKHDHNPFSLVTTIESEPKKHVSAVSRIDRDLSGQRLFQRRISITKREHEQSRAVCRHQYAAITIHTHTVRLKNVLFDGTVIEFAKKAAVRSKHTHAPVVEITTQPVSRAIDRQTAWMLELTAAKQAQRSAVVVEHLKHTRKR